MPTRSSRQSFLASRLVLCGNISLVNFAQVLDVMVPAYESLLARAVAKAADFAIKHATSRIVPTGDVALEIRAALEIRWARAIRLHTAVVGAFETAILIASSMVSTLGAYDGI